MGAVVVAQLVQRLLSTPEVLVSNLGIGKLLVRAFVYCPNALLNRRVGAKIRQKSLFSNKLLDSKTKKTYFAHVGWAGALA